MQNNVVSLDKFKEQVSDKKATASCVNHLKQLFSLREQKFMRLSTESFIRPVMDILKNYILTLNDRMIHKKDILDAIDFCVETDSDIPRQYLEETRTYSLPFSNTVPVCAAFKIADSLAFAAEDKVHLVNNDDAVFADITMSYCTSGEIFEGVFGEAFKMDIEVLLEQSDEFISELDPESDACLIFIHELLKTIDDEGYIFFKLIGESPFPKKKCDDVKNAPDKTYLATRGDVIIRLDVYAKRYFKHVNTLNDVLSINEENDHEH